MATIFLGMPSEMYASFWSYMQTFFVLVIAAVISFGKLWLNRTQQRKVDVWFRNWKEAMDPVDPSIKYAVGMCAVQQLWKHGLGAASDLWSIAKTLVTGKDDLENMKKICGNTNGATLYAKIDNIEGEKFEEKFDKYRQQQLEKFRAKSLLHRKEFIGAFVVLATATLYCVANDVSYLSELPFAFAFAGMLIYRVVEDEIDDAFQRFVCEPTDTD